MPVALYSQHKPALPAWSTQEVARQCKATFDFTLSQVLGLQDMLVGAELVKMQIYKVGSALGRAAFECSIALGVHCGQAMGF